MTQLTSLRVSHDSFSARGLRQLKKALPGCVIVTAPIDDPERAAAEWTLGFTEVDRCVDVRDPRTDEIINVRRKEDLPAEPFYVDAINCWGVEGVNDRGIRNLEGLRHIKNLILCGTSVGDEGMRTIAELKSLRRLDLGGAGHQRRGRGSALSNAQSGAFDSRPHSGFGRGIEVIGYTTFAPVPFYREDARAQVQD